MASQDADLAAEAQRRLPSDQAPPLDKMLQREQRDFDDCLPCRTMGATAFIGLGVYSYVSGHHQLRQQHAALQASKTLFGLRARKASITGLSAVLVGMGVYRFVA
ncbi:uncharacterized protein K452DRAFT_291742 [Aplosporella prunicola CBS 121167]|uniref:Distal membrane-arm assembly complex protein 1-like domain-containing protein n=1 Tax=Aplosporella prunicola CBS 121167 TaxID=1176127 RepID=A0A6A6B1F2_9PEZI|nr:uncharacterized protein K452DRAFT_291742 [Aplosporella prunicola CBS 121167]KAF2137203.1 hypothetical protein K452DRAFT_291742 [Aplosporella prunicola CBS 121167]